MKLKNFLLLPLLTLTIIVNSTFSINAAETSKLDESLSYANVNLVGAKKIDDSIFELSDSTIVALVNNTVIELERFSIDFETDGIDKVRALESKLQPESYKSLLNDFVDSKMRTDSNIESIDIYVPFDASRAVTYQGYGNFTYFEEVFIVKNNTGPQLVSSNKSIQNLAVGIISAYVKHKLIDGMVTVLLGKYALAAIFTDAFITYLIENIGVGPSTVLKQYAGLVETKTKVFTYVVLSDGYHFGYRVEKNIADIVNFVTVPGVIELQYGELVDFGIEFSENYYTPDKLAYFGYLDGGAIERFDSYTFGSLNFVSVY